MSRHFIDESLWDQLLDRPLVYNGQFRVCDTEVVVREGKVLIGIDSNELRHLLIPVLPKQSVAEDRKSSGVHIINRELMDGVQRLYFIDVVCLKKHLQQLFTILADEILAILEKDASAPFVSCIRTLNQWRELLERDRPSMLGDAEITGLFGELLFVRTMAECGNLAMKWWTGPKKGRYDIYKNSIAIEVKTTTARNGRFVEIHGVEQLVAPPEGELYLAFVRLETSDLAGESLPELIDSIIEKGIERHEFLDLLAAVGYDTNSSEEYARYRFVVKENRIYRVTDGFPRILPESFSSQMVPQGIVWIRYQIDLTTEPPLPMDEKEVGILFQRISEKHL